MNAGQTPVELAQPDDPSGEFGIASLAEQMTGHETPLTFIGAVRNVVESPHRDYDWPTPHAYFGVWASDNAPIVEGTWVSIRDDPQLRDRHWFPLAR
ncbi:hypothetical protein [Microbacterium sp. SORGH_AS_0888]|uniref:hypothetical protein n=1 Tax=Microbacterium sp. SORGH_AS_0888 TaxID=3041791 RepID=UPI00277EB39E|nr:hypothetical protein [Microbacterium sp. SORGH_AS_0888]MDQ1130702.1 hypothetical protein [Microbacterium sp. SORGH_AS_0888]